MLFMKNDYPILPGIECLTHRFKGFLLDAYGVFWGGNRIGTLPGAKEKMAHLVSNGKIVGILSNTTQRVEREIEKFIKHGLIQDQHFHFIVTSGELAKSIFLNQQLPFPTPRHTYWLFGGIHPHFSSHVGLFQDSVYMETAEISQADFIYISIPHISGEDQTDPEVFRQEIEKIKSYHLPMVCPNPDCYAHEGNPVRAVVRQGMIARMYEEIGGKVFYIGKPSLQGFVAAMEKFNLRNIVNPSDVLMVGDTPETDIRGARLFGMPSALVTKTGIMAERIVHQGIQKALSNDIPDYFIEQL